MSEHLRPSFFIIGERKCGTSSLYRYLLEHPSVLPGARKEMQFFTKGREHVSKNWDSYLREFPSSNDTAPAALDWPELDKAGNLFEERLGFARESGADYITGEASADTFCDGDPELLREFLPDLRLIVLLRDPSERAFSHHRMFRRFQEEGRELGFTVGGFAEDMRAEMQRTDSAEPSPCIGPSLYLANLVRWQHVWGEALEVLFTSELDTPAAYSRAMARVLSHLALAQHPYALAERYNQAPKATMDAEIREELRAFFAPHDAALAQHLGRALPWQQ